MRPDIVALLKSSKSGFICSLMGIDPVATFRWAVLRAYFRAIVAFRAAGKRHGEKKSGKAIFTYTVLHGVLSYTLHILKIEPPSSLTVGSDPTVQCAVMKRVDSFSFLHHPVHQRSLEILQRCKDDKYSKLFI